MKVEFALLVWHFPKCITASFQHKFSRADPCSVDFGCETPKFRFEFCRGFFGGFFLLFFSKEKGPKKSTKKSPAKFTRDFVRKNSPRISAEGRSLFLTNSTLFHNENPQAWPRKSIMLICMVSSFVSMRLRSSEL